MFGLDQKCEMSYFFLIESFLPLRFALETSILSDLKSLGWVGGCTCDHNVSLSLNLWIMTFNMDLNLDLGLTIIE